jgi:hypothetical protein
VAFSVSLAGCCGWGVGCGGLSCYSTRDWFAPTGTRSCRYSLQAVKKHCEAHSAAGSS